MSRVAVIGAGQWGANLVRTFSDLKALAAIVEVHPLIRSSVRAAYPDVPLYESYQSVLASEIPAVVIATPAATHFPIARDALLAGKDVFVEKPIALSSAEANELHRLAVEQERILMVGHLLLYQPAVQWIKSYIDSKALGKLYSLHQQRAKLGRVRSVENVLWSLGVHDIAVLLYLVGEPIGQIQVNGQRALQQHIEDDIYLHMSFASGVQAHLHTSWLWPEQERRLILVGSRGMLVYEELGQTVTLHRKGIHDDLSSYNDGSEVLFHGTAQPLQEECEHFLACISSRQPPLAGGENGIAVVRVIEECMQLLKEGTIDERKWLFCP